MPAVAKKSAKAALSKPDDVEKKQKKQSVKKLQKTVEINAAKKLAKLKSTRAVSDKLNRAPAVRRQKAKHQFDPLRLKRGVVLIKNLPKGFFEKQLKKYFTQYGRVTRLRLARSERTGGSKGYAYVEFKYPEVAKVAAETMNDYLMFRQRLKTVYIAPDDQDHDYFKQPVRFVKQRNGKVKLVTPTTIRAARAVANYNKPVSAETQAERTERSKYKLKFLEKKLAKAGINVDLSGQFYEGNPAEADEKPKNNADKKGKNKQETKPSKKSKKAAAENGNTTLENLLENTIQTSDDEDDDDYEPSADEIAEADKFVKSLLNEESDEENETTLNRFLNDTIDSDESDDDDYEPTQKEIEEATAAAKKAGQKLSKIDSTSFASKKKNKSNEKPSKKAQKKQKAGNNNNTTLDNLLNNTIASDESEGEEYAPTQEEIKKASVHKGGKKATKVEILTKQGKKPVEKSQNKRKFTAVEAPKPTQQEVPTNKKKKVVESNKPATPKPDKSKVRKNFVTAPTPEPVKPKKKSKPVVENTVKPAKAKKNSNANETKEPAKPQKFAGNAQNAANKKGKQPKKALNKKK